MGHGSAQENVGRTQANKNSRPRIGATPSVVGVVMTIIRIAFLVAILAVGVVTEAAGSLSKIFLEGGAVRRGRQSAVNRPLQCAADKYNIPQA